MRTYFYNQQFRRYITQFMRIFNGLKVQSKVDRNSDLINDFINIPIHYGDMDKIVAQVLHGEGTFTPSKIPLMSCYLTGIELNPDIKKPKSHTEHIKVKKSGDRLPTMVSRIMGVPYRAKMELNIYASNTDQMFQILEQILLIFNPYLTIQKSDNIFDWSYLTSVELITINNAQNVPAGTDQRVIIWTLEFQFDCWLNFPAKEQSSIIEEIQETVFDDTYILSGDMLERQYVSSLPQLSSKVTCSSSVANAEMDIIL